MIALLDECPEMTGILSALFRLLLPLIREWWKKKNWSTHSIRNLREIHLIFCMFIVLFALFLYVIDHGLGIYLHYSDKMHVAAIEAGKVEQIINNNKYLAARNERLEEQLQGANKIIAFLVNNNPSLAPPAGQEETPKEVSSADRVEGLKKKYGGQ